MQDWVFRLGNDENLIIATSKKEFWPHCDLCNVAFFQYVWYNHPSSEAAVRPHPKKKKILFKSFYFSSQNSGYQKILDQILGTRKFSTKFFVKFRIQKTVKKFRPPDKKILSQIFMWMFQFYSACVRDLDLRLAPAAPVLTHSLNYDLRI